MKIPKELIKEYVKSENFWYYSLNGSATKEYIMRNVCIGCRGYSICRR